MKTDDSGSECCRNPSRQLDDPRVVEALDEYLTALEAGKKPDRQAFLARHSAIADVLAECLEGMEALHQASSVSNQSGGTLAGAAGLLDGTPLGDYRLLREIGRGGMGIVYEAEQLSLGRRIALKVLPFALTFDPRQLQRFKNEARAAAQLHHQHIVPVYAVGTERGVHFYAMQYIEGQSLAEVIRDLRRQGKPGSLFRRESPPSVAAADATASYIPQAEATNLLSSAPRPSDTVKSVSALATSFSSDSRGFYRTVARLGIQAAEALEHAHEYGVVHRDIKPGNLMVDAHGHLWITDFGLAQFHTDAGLTQSGDLLGTLRYMSPEQASGQRVNIDHRTDIYSLGATLYELLTQQSPFESNNRQALLHQILNDEPKPPGAIQKAIPAELETIILKALAKSPSERYATARELADDLSRYLQDKPIHARRATAVQRLRKWARRHPSVVWAVVVLGFFAVAGSLVSAALIGQAYEREKTRAEEAKRDLQLARDAVDGMFNLCEEELAGKPFLDGLRQRLLKDYFLDYYQKLIDRHEDDPQAQAKLSATRQRVLEILGNLAELQGMGQYQLLNHPGVVNDIVRNNQEQREQIERLKKEIEDRRKSLPKLSSEQKLKYFLDDARWMESEGQRILTEKQKRRLREIDLQFKGIRAFEEQDVIDQLQLRADQREKIRAILAQDFCAAFGDCHPPPPDKRHGPPRDGRPPESPPSFSHGGRDRAGVPPPDPVKQIVDTVLDGKQQAIWGELTGERFRPFGSHPGWRPGPHGPRSEEPRP